VEAEAEAVVISLTSEDVEDRPELGAWIVVKRLL